MFKQILYTKQLDILRILEIFSKDFYLSWGTAIALQLGHRKSLDFDLFSKKPIQASKILKKLKSEWLRIDRTLVDNNADELTLIVKGVKITFLYYPFEVELSKNFAWIKLPDIITLWAMKFYTLWRRWKWKDYVDIYQILKEGSDFWKISELADKIFEWWYNEKLLREQLCYYEDIDYSEQVEYMWESIKPDIIKEYLIEISKQ